jgi:hypothetical protein
MLIIVFISILVGAMIYIWSDALMQKDRYKLEELKSKYDAKD